MLKVFSKCLLLLGYLPSFLVFTGVKAVGEPRLIEEAQRYDQGDLLIRDQAVQRSSDINKFYWQSSLTIEWDDYDSPSFSRNLSPQLPPNTNLFTQFTGGNNEKITAADSPFMGNELTQSSPTPTDEKSFSSPLTNYAGVQSTANQLNEGEVIFNIYNRVFFVPESLATDATSAYLGGGFTWGISDDLEMTAEGQFIDTGLPYQQGPFQTNTISDINSARSNIVLEFKQRLWENEAETTAISGIVSLDWTDSNYRFRDPDTRQVIAQDDVKTLVPTLKVPWTSRIGENFQFTLSPTIAFFPNSSALVFFRAPVENPGSFGTTFGVTAGLSYKLGSRAILWADGFFPLTGNNSISRASGRTSQVIPYNVGIRYLQNPMLALDIYATNALGNKGALALTADRDLMALGFNLTFMPNFIGNNYRYANSFDPAFAGKSSPVKGYGLGLAERSYLNQSDFRFDVIGGSNGILGNLSYSFVKDLDVGIYVDYVFSQIDESEQGLSAKFRFLNQAEGSPFGMSLAATLGQTNEPFVNFINNDRFVADRRQFDNSVPNVFETDSLFRGRLKIVTLSLPFTYDFDNGPALWLTPIWGYVQSQGTELAGFNAGVSVPIGTEFTLIGEIGQSFVGDGNAFIGDDLGFATPWTFAFRWNPSNLQIQTRSVPLQPHLELYLTNRVGFTPWLQMRVRDQNKTAVGASLMVPF